MLILYNVFVSLDKITIFTDGASKGNPGPGGWGAVISIGEEVIELGGMDKKTTNNEMELVALLRSLEYLDGYEPKVHVYVDSKYVLNGVTKWLSKWKTNDWKTTAKKPVLHKNIWEKLDVVLGKYSPTLEYIPGHAGIHGNERADGIAQRFAEGKKVHLFSGKREDYPVDLSDLDKKHSGASAKKKRSRAKAHSYVSCVGGVVRTHSTWEDCEKYVKGAQGARFKKALSQTEETKLIEEYTRGIS